MDSEERWLKITSSFSNIAPINPNQSRPHKLTINSNKVVPNIQDETETNFHHRSYSHPKTKLVHLSTNDPPDHETVKNLATKIHVLESVLKEKSEIILEQRQIIYTLKKKLKSGECSQKLSKETQTDNCIPINHRSVSSSSSSMIKTSKITSNNIHQVVEELESKMSKMINSLPNKITNLCTKFMSSCKFRWDKESEHGEFLIMTHHNHNDKEKEKEETEKVKKGCCCIMVQPEKSKEKPIWSKSPNIPPRLNISSKIRQNKGLNSHTQKSSHDHPSVVVVNSDDDVQTQMKRLEAVVSELKVSFIQLLLDKLTTEQMKSCPPQNKKT